MSQTFQTTAEEKQKAAEAAHALANAKRLAEQKATSEDEQRALAAKNEDIIQAQIESGAKKELVVKAQKIVTCYVKDLPNCGYVNLNGDRLTLTPAGTFVKCPVSYAHAFPNFLTAAPE